MDYKIFFQDYVDFIEFNCSSALLEFPNVLPAVEHPDL